MAESIEVGGAGKMTKVNPQQTKLRAAFKEQFPDDILKSLFLGKEQSRLLAEMKSFKEKHPNSPLPAPLYDFMS